MGAKAAFGDVRLEGKPDQCKPLSEHRAAQEIGAVPLYFSLLLRTLPLGDHSWLSLDTLGILAQFCVVRAQLSKAKTWVVGVCLTLVFIWDSAE